MNRSRSDILLRAIQECLNELYKASQPSITYEEIEENYKNGKYAEVPHYEQHYLSQEEQTEIIEHFIYIYDIKNKWKEDAQFLYDCLNEGGLKTVYVDGRRDSENTPPLKELIGEENANKVLTLITDFKDFYMGGTDEQYFLFNVINYSPNINKTTVRDYWSTKGIDLKFKKRVYNEDIEDYEYVDEEN